MKRSGIVEDELSKRHRNDPENIEGGNGTIGETERDNDGEPTSSSRPRAEGTEDERRRDKSPTPRSTEESRGNGRGRDRSPSYRSRGNERRDGRDRDRHESSRSRDDGRRDRRRDERRDGSSSSRSNGERSNGRSRDDASPSRSKGESRERNGRDRGGARADRSPSRSNGERRGGEERDRRGHSPSRSRGESSGRERNGRSIDESSSSRSSSRRDERSGDRNGRDRESSSSMSRSRREGMGGRASPSSFRGRDNGRVDGIPSGRGRGRGRGGGRGRGASRGRGRGGITRVKREEARAQRQFDLVVSRATDPSTGVVATKQGSLEKSTKIQLEGNFFPVVSRPNWLFYHYRVDFIPDEMDTRKKKAMVALHKDSLGANLCDGSSVYKSEMLDEDPLTLYSMRPSDGQQFQLIFRLVGTVAPTDVTFLQLLNLIMRKCLDSMSLSELGRYYYDSNKAINIPAHHLQLWPGYITSMRQYENDVLLKVELVHKVLRTDNCLQIINELSEKFKEDRKKIRNSFLGNIVMTYYNNKTYRIDDIDWDTTPSGTFDLKGVQSRFLDYFYYRHNITIRDAKQPMLVSRPTKRDFHKGATGSILLIPELCRMTGISEEMRKNFQLMKAIDEHLHTTPQSRVMKLKDFMAQMRRVPDIQNDLKRWGLQFQDNPVGFQGRTLDKVPIMFGVKGNKQLTDFANSMYDWNHAFYDKPAYLSVAMREWVVIVPSQHKSIVGRLVSAIQRIAKPMEFSIQEPREIINLPDHRPNSYVKAIDAMMNKYAEKLQLVLLILPSKSTEVYGAIKKRTCVDFGVPSQCITAQNAGNEKTLMSICTKLVVQMSAKIGGIPWKVGVPPLAKLMVIGFNVHHCGKRRGSSIGAMVASTGPDSLAGQGKYFSCVSQHSSRDNLSECMGLDFRKCLMAYKIANGVLPERIIMYRDGMGEGQLAYVKETELKAIQETLKDVYDQAGFPDGPNFAFIVVTKRINARIFTKQEGSYSKGYDNPPPGTVVDDVITLPERYDFYLVSQYAKNGTVSPVAYNILHDKFKQSPGRLQQLTFRLCHTYYNWSGPVTVPAPCQYAQKLAYLTGTALEGRNSSEKLSNLLYYL